LRILNRSVLILFGVITIPRTSETSIEMHDTARHAAAIANREPSNKAPDHSSRSVCASLS
jgi:hypothetical protein